MNNVSVVFPFLASLMLISMPIFVLYKDWKNEVNRYFAFYDIGAFGILFTMFLTYAFKNSINLTLLNKYTQFSTVAFFASLFLMSFIFPKREKKFKLLYSFLILLPAYIMGIIIVSTDLTISGAYFKNGVFVRDFNFFYKIYAVLAFLYLLAGTIHFIVKYILSKEPIHKLQMRYLFVGSSIAITLASVTSIILPNVFHYSKLYTIGASLAAFVTTIAMFYSVIVHNLMDISTAIHKTTMYLISSAIIFIPIFGFLYFYEIMPTLNKSIPLHLVISLIVLIYILFSIFLQPVIDKFFKRKQYLFEELIDNFIRKVGLLKDSKTVIEKTIDILFNSLFLKNAFFVMLSEDLRGYSLFYGRGSIKKKEFAQISKGASIIRWFIRNRELLTKGRVFNDEKTFGEIREDLLKFFDEYDVLFILPIFHERRLLGLICLGPKDSLAAYTPEEIIRLADFQVESNQYISTALSYEKARKEQFMDRTVEVSNYILKQTNPVNLPNIKGYGFGSFIIPRYEGGTVDYFDFIRPGNLGFGSIFSNVSGAGVKKSLYSVIIRSVFQSGYEDAPLTSKMMEKINNVIYLYSLGLGKLVTAYYYYIDFESSRLLYTNAGFPPLELFKVERNDFISLDSEGAPLGFSKDLSFGMGRTTMERGDIVILYSKSLINSKNSSNEDFGIVRLRDIVRNNRGKTATLIADKIKKEFVSFLGFGTPPSDLLLLIMKKV